MKDDGMAPRKRAHEFDKDVAQKIRAARVARGVSQTSLGEALGVTFQQVQKYEKGVNRVSAGNLVRIAGMLHVPITQLLPEGGDNGSDPPLPTDVLSQSRDGVALARAFNRINSSRFRHKLVELAELLADAEQGRR
jgi:transcriptional regulator with XRE-family HTH domain